MSVELSKRSISKFEFFKLGTKIHDSIYNLVMQDFGFKAKTKDFYAFTNKADMDDNDKFIFIDICKKYDINVEADFPKFMLDHFKEKVLYYDDLFLDDLTTANTIFINTVFEYNLKRGYIWKCISDLNILLQYFQSIIRMIPLKPERKEKYIVYTDMIDKELKLLRELKKSCNKQYSYAYNMDLKRNNKAIKTINNYADSKTTQLIPSDEIIDTAASTKSPITTNFSRKQVESISTSNGESTIIAINPFHSVEEKVITPFHKVDAMGRIIRSPFHNLG